MFTSTINFTLAFNLLVYVSQSLKFKPSVATRLTNSSLFSWSAETFLVDIGNTKKLLEGERGKIVCERNIIVSGLSFVRLVLLERNVQFNVDVLLIAILLLFY